MKSSQRQPGLDPGSGNWRPVTNQLQRRGSPISYLSEIALCALLAGFLVVVSGCRRPSQHAPDIMVREQIEPTPVRVGEAAVTIQMADAAANPVSRATVQVEADMAHPGMAPIFGAARETRPGTYLAHIDFNMGGDWVLLLHIKLADGRILERQVDVRGVQSN